MNKKECYSNKKLRAQMEAFTWIEEKREWALTLLIKWACINSWSHNPTGLAQMKKEIKEIFDPISDVTNELEFIKRKGLPKKILFGGHMDTVYPPHSSFQTCRISGSRLIGPGVADMKGGLIVLYLALFAFEKFSDVKNFGWEIFINPDEEIGSPGSRTLWEEKGKKATIGLLFEPSFADGAIVDKRKGSFSFKVEVKGTPAHVGRDFDKGRSAIFAIAEFISASSLLSKTFSDLTLNVGELHSDSPTNVVAEIASCSINIRSFSYADLLQMKDNLMDLSLKISHATETTILLSPLVEKQPKPFSEGTKKLFEELSLCAAVLNTKLTTKSSGGLSDGNILAEVNLPCIDTLGVIGGNLHTPEEYMEIESMIERAKLVFLFLCRYTQIS